MSFLATILDGLRIALHTFALGLSVFVGHLGIHYPAPPLSSPALVATTTAPLATTTLPAVVVGATSTKPIAATQTAVKTATNKLKAVSPIASTTPAAVVPASPIPKAPATPAINPIELNTEVRTALVNIYCTTRADGYLHPISGSGVFIDQRGVILTNAHVAQFFLLKDYPTQDNITCVVRTGSPASPQYTAELLYISPQWIAANASQLGSAIQTGTGENDFAFLRVTGTTNPNGTLPGVFPAVPLSSNIPDTGSSILAAAYPAGFLEGITIERNLYISSAFTTLEQLYTFDTPNTVDVLALKGSVVAQAGSSGGAAVDASTGKLIGLISTEIVAATTADRVLNAITINYIDRALAARGLGGIAGLLTGNITATAKVFNADVAPLLTAKLIAGLNKTN
ncbi:MAG: hypothetical protein JWO43_495 [Candidatus Adlerbacteria bacterium]|nr:hypothetical protein [Candidatus Adlerbacteria bacterium]